MFVTSIFPPHASKTLAEIYVKTLKELRSQLRDKGIEIIPNTIKATTAGIEIIGVWDIKEGKLEEFLAIEQRALTNYHDVEGYRYEMDVRFKVPEALDMILIKIEINYNYISNVKNLLSLFFYGDRNLLIPLEIH